jgi:hypothetical protein
MAEFQQQVTYAYAAGLPGEIAADGPLRAQSFRLVANTTTPTNPIGFGQAFVYAPGGDVSNPNGIATTQTATPGTDGTSVTFAGILINPKAHALYGTVSGGPLAPSYQLPDGSWGELCTMGILFVSITAATAAAGVAGAQVAFDAVGNLVAVAPGAAAPAGTQLIKGAFLNTNIGLQATPVLAVITLTGAQAQSA